MEERNNVWVTGDVTCNAKSLTLSLAHLIIWIVENTSDVMREIPDACSRDRLDKTYSVHKVSQNFMPLIFRCQFFIYKRYRTRNFSTSFFGMCAIIIKNLGLLYAQTFIDDQRNVLTSYRPFYSLRLATWPLHECEAEGDFLIQTFFLLLWNLC